MTRETGRRALRKRLVELYEAVDKPDEVEKWQAELEHRNAAEQRRRISPAGRERPQEWRRVLRPLLFTYRAEVPIDELRLEFAADEASSC